MKIEKLTHDDIAELSQIWVESVQATHHFLAKEDFLFYQSVVPNYLKIMDLYGIRKHQIVGFLGVQDQTIETLFVQPNFFRQGIGKALLSYALTELNATKIDVNEQNQKALAFYVHFGFRVVSRSESDPTGRPYPILHLKYQKDEIFGNSDKKM